MNILFQKKAISPVVATALLLVVAVTAVIGFQTWFGEFSSSTFSNVEIKSQTDAGSNSGIEIIVGNILYFKNNIEDNLSILEIKVGNNVCNISDNFNISLGVKEIDLGNCTNNLTTATPEIFVQTKDNIYSKKIYLKDKQISSSGSTTPQSSIDCTGLNGGEWIGIPGNSALGTDDFCVMKFEAKNDGSDNPISQTTNTPWASISQTDAIAECNSLGANYHLITNAEWTTIARNAENINSNWNSSTVGIGRMWKGHGDNSPNNALSVSNINDYYDQTGNSGSSVERRILTLNNSEIIWDFGGNVWEWNNDTCLQGDPWYSTPGWTQWTDGNINGAEKNLAGPIGDYNVANGIGRYYGCTSSGNAFRRGGSWNAGGSTGAFSLFLHNTPSSLETYIGFRCTYTP